MTNQSPLDSENNQATRSFGNKVVKILQKPQTQVISLITLTAIIMGGYAGGKHLLTVIPLKVEKELEKVLNRDVSLGNISFFRLIKLFLKI